MPICLRLDLAYDGAPFAGWAAQPGLATVEGTLTEALCMLCRTPVRLTVAGRTDAGVHARGQVAHVDVPVGAWTLAPGRSDRAPAEAFTARLNGVLARLLGAKAGTVPPVVVHSAALAAPGFDARFSALARRYVYRISDGAARRDPLRRDALAHPRPLDPSAMTEAGERLLGEHDFLSFCKPREGATTIRTLQRLAATRRQDGLIEVEVQADAFCHSMVRAIIGTLLQVGEGRRERSWAAERLAGHSHEGMQVAPAHGLTLEEVSYPAEAELAARAALTRRRRDEES